MHETYVSIWVIVQATRMFDEVHKGLTFQIVT